MFEILRATQPIERTYSWRTSIRGYIIIVLCFIGISIFTLLTRGYGERCAIDSRPADVFDAKICNTTTIYAGQTFALPQDGNFVFSAATWTKFTKPVSFAAADCRLMSGGNNRLEVVARPVLLPTIKFFFEIVCAKGASRAKDARIINSYANVSLYDNEIVLSVQGMTAASHNLINGAGKIDGKLVADRILDANFEIIEAYDALSQPAGSTSTLEGYVLFGNADRDEIIVTETTAGQETYLRGNVSANTVFRPLIPPALALFQDISSTMINDISRDLFSQLTFPCEVCQNKWLATSAVNIAALLWTVIVACASLWAVSKFLASLLMTHLEPSPSMPQFLKAYAPLGTYPLSPLPHSPGQQQMQFTHPAYTNVNMQSSSSIVKP